MASRNKTQRGYLSELNANSSADADFVLPKKIIKYTRSTHWEVERLVERRERNGAVSVWL